MSAARNRFFLTHAVGIAFALFAFITMSACSAGRIAAPRYVLSYGVSDYPGTVSDLASPAVDAPAISALFVAYGYLDDGYAYQHTGAVTNSEVTKSRIKADIEGLANLEKQSIIAVCFSLHGWYDSSSGASYLVPHNAVDGNGHLIIDTENCLISPSELSNWIAQSGQRNVIMIIHSCYSGGFVDPGSSIDIAPQNYGPNDWGTTPSGLWPALGKFGELLAKNSEKRGAPGPIVISAAGTNESAWESASPFFGGHAVFPYFILTSAQQGDLNGDGLVTATEAYAHAASGIKLYWNYVYQDVYDPINNPPDPNQGNIYIYPDFMPHISGASRDLVLFQN